MNLEQLEYKITLYLDGTLPAEDRPALEQLVQEDAEVRRLLDEHRKLDAILTQARVLPAVNWDKLSRHLAQSLAQEETPVRNYSLFGAFSARRLALAASVLIACAFGWTLLRPHAGPIAPLGPVVVNISGPQAETTPASAVTDITIGPAPSFAAVGDLYYSQDVISRPSNVVIASGSTSAQDSDQPY